MKLAWEDGREILERYARINQLLNKTVYSPTDKAEIKDLLRKLGVAKKDDGGRYAQPGLRGFARFLESDLRRTWEV
jgi:hypothetical protein